MVISSKALPFPQLGLGRFHYMTNRKDLEVDVSNIQIPMQLGFERGQMVRYCKHARKYSHPIVILQILHTLTYP